MFKHQLVAETVPSIDDRAAAPSLNDAGAMLRLLEQHTGYSQFRVDLPGEVTWAPEVAHLHGETHPRRASLEDALRDYVPEDRTRIIDTIRAAVAERRGYHFTARMEANGKTRVVDVIGDVRIEDGVVAGVWGLARDVSSTVEREAMALSRARLIRHMVEDMPVPVVVLDRALRVVACSTEWARSYGLQDRASALNQPLGKLVDVSRETTAAIIEALNGRTAQIELWFYSGVARRDVRQSCAVIPWQCGTDTAGGVMMVIGGGEPTYATLEMADRALGRTTRGLLQMLEKISA